MSELEHLLWKVIKDFVDGELSLQVATGVSGAKRISVVKNNTV